ncbi:sigma-54 interaction domain-containing protein [Fundidesulfovibrio terrae]|uniref:sigma-54 interaction domain-containing protein n=1 Tax=Fundidesulfovibrio terrae TaxID=2922866 RepID=UPI001FAF04FF|nr:sigma-54 dependent transcriptional regulator [Fundidesulfovibrio terrae]
MFQRMRVDISLGVLIPFILGGLAALFVLGLTAVRELGYLAGLTRVQFGYASAAGTGLTVFGVAMLLGRLVLRPVKQFLGRAKNLPMLKEPAEKMERARGAEIDALDKMFEHVTHVLESLDAKALFPEIIGESRALRGVLAQVAKVAPSDATVLLTGESGTGKDLFANTVHAHSKRKDKPFVAVNCAAIPPGLMESELFGHEKGAFTGAIAAKKGKFEQASGGTLFLDEIGDMPIETQAKILRALENGEAERVGGDKPVRFNVRLVAATNKNLQEMIGKNEFREDLYHRLNVFPLLLPPLRVRPEDIPLLATHFLERFGPGLTIATEALQLLMAYAWPGNVRELRNTLERAAVLAGEHEVVLAEHLPSQVRLVSASEPQLPIMPESRAKDLDERLEEIEKGLIIAALVRCNGVQVRAAEILGIKERSLWHRVKKYGVDPASYKRN